MLLIKHDPYRSFRSQRREAQTADQPPAGAFVFVFVEVGVASANAESSDALSGTELEAVASNAPDVRECKGCVVEEDQIAIAAAKECGGEKRVVVSHFHVAAALGPQSPIAREGKVKLADRWRAKGLAVCRPPFVAA